MSEKAVLPVAADEQARDAGDRGFLPIAVDTLCPISTLDFDLYVRPTPGGPAVLYREREYPLDREDLDRLRERGFRTLYIRSAKHVAYRRYLREEVIKNKDLSPAQRYNVLRTAHRTVFETAFRSGNLDQMVELSGEISQQMVRTVCDRDFVLSAMLSLMEHDYYTYTHAINVCTYCLVLATRLGIENGVDLEALATGALLHDIGKQEIPPAILNQRRRLTKQQRELIKQHPTIGFRKLCLREDLTWAQLMMVYQHHERVDGRGYPVQLRGDEIHPWARICTLCDVFDALISDRPYRKANRVDSSLALLKERRGKHFDEGMVECWSLAIGSRS